MKGKAEVTVTLTVEGEEMYGENLAQHIKMGLDEQFDDVEKLDIYTL